MVEHLDTRHIFAEAVEAQQILVLLGQVHDLWTLAITWPDFLCHDHSFE